MKCKICNQRPAKRHCPGVQGYICALCCGQEREVSIDCPFECDYLQQAHRYEMERKELPAEFAFPAHEVPRTFVEENQQFIGGMAATLLQHASQVPGIRDDDLRTVLDSLIRTYETLATGLVYESLPDGSMRVQLFRQLQSFVEEWRKREAEQLGVARLRDADVLKSLVFLRRLAQTHDNGRPRGRLFYGYLRRMFPNVTGREAPSLIVPGR